VNQARQPGPAPVADFTSALVLGLAHGSGTLSWKSLSTGTPAALRTSPTARRVARAFAALVGCEQAVAMTSTLHAFSDLFGCTWRRPAAILHDEAVYPIARWGMERAERRGARPAAFRHLDPESLRRALERAQPHHAPPWVVTDGVCAGCGRAAPLDAYTLLARRFGGIVLVDDAQAIGLHGRCADASAPYGRGGGGSLARLGIERDPAMVVIASLAKAFGAPLALVAGSRAFVDGVTADSETLVHCSPPAEPVLVAARRALGFEARAADARRARLADRVRRLRAELHARGFAVRGGLFPMQRVLMPDAATARALNAGLLRRGVRAVVRRARCNAELSLTFVVTAAHDDAQIAAAAEALAEAARALARASSAHHPSSAHASISSARLQNLEA
jgi:8-amino-7-oxononanoate synthase